MLSFLFRSKPGLIALALLVYRLGFGLTMIVHGYQKFAGGKERLTGVGSMLSVLGINRGHCVLGALAGIAEILGGIFILLGYATRLGGMLVSGTLAVATIVSYPLGYLKWDYPAQLGLGALMLAIAGGGKYSLEAKKNK